MDPLVFFSPFQDIPEMVFDHFSGKQLIRISRVSPIWYDFIASSKDLMKKIKIVFKGSRSRFPHDQLSDSSRFYQVIEVKRDRSIPVHLEGPLVRLRIIPSNHKCLIRFQELNFFLEKCRHGFKEVGVVNTFFKNELDAWNFLSSFQETVEKLSLESVEIGSDLVSGPSTLDSFEVLNFPKLKELKLHLSDKVVNSKYLTTVLLNCVAVEKLDLKDVFRHDDMNNSELCLKMLETFSGLTSLKLYAINIDQMFESQTWQKFKFRLKSFTMDSTRLTIQSERGVRINFLNFLQSQSETLEKLSIDPCFNLETLNVIMTMPKLKSLRLNSFPFKTETGIVTDDDIFDEKISSKKSDTITDLTVNENVPCTGCLYHLLRVMPRVKKLELYAMDEFTIQLFSLIDSMFDKLTIDHLTGAASFEEANVYTNILVIKNN